jgi:carbonic anhydrase
MCEHRVEGLIAPAPFARRNVLKFAGAAAAALALGHTALAKEAKMPPKPQNVLSPDAALDRLMDGNKRYVEGLTKRYDLAREREALTNGQNPFAAILGCADSRIAAEFCFDTALGDVFVCRVAGNFANEDIIASLEYTVAILKTPLIMVLGHEACGAVDATVKSVTEGTTLPGHLPALVAAIRPAVEAVKNQGGDVLANAIRDNVKLNVERLQNASPILDKAVGDKSLRVVGGVYRLDSGKVDLV